MSKKASASNETKFKLDRDIVRALFQEVEDSGVSRFDFDLAKVVNNKSHTFGDPGSDKRRALQKKFADSKRKTHHRYLRFLGKFGIAPGEALKRELLEDDDEGDNEEDNEEGGDDESSGYSSDDSSITTEVKPKPPQKKTSTNKDSSTTKKGSSTTKKEHTTKGSKSPPVVIEVEKKSTPIKRMKVDTDTYTSATEISSDFTSEASCDIIRRVLFLEKHKIDGTKQNPYIVIADPDRPETSMGFEVALVPNIKVGNFMRSVFHIRHVTTQGMEDEWSAIIPREEFPELANRAILVRGPSQELWHRRPDLYHEESFCNQTALIHEAQQTAIKQSEVRMYSYWLIVLPKGTMLENYVISHDSTHVVKGTQEMTQAFEIEDDQGKVEMETLYGMDVYWRIAVAGGNMVSDPASATKKRRKKKAATKS